MGGSPAAAATGARARNRWRRGVEPYDSVVLAVLPVLAAGFAVPCAGLVLATPVLLDGGPAWALSVLAAAGTVVLLAVCALGRAGRLTTSGGDPVAALAALVLLAVALALLALTGEPEATAAVQLALVAAGAALVAPQLGALVMAAGWLGWYAVAARIGPDPSWVWHALGMAAATVVAATINEVRRRNLVALCAAREVAQAAAVQDHLTGLANRRGLMLLGTQIVEAARRRDEAVHAVFLDVDGLKHVNDELGDEAGDAVLVAVGAALRSVTRGTDVAGRWGGDEFCVIGPGPGGKAIDLERRVCERVREAPPVDETVWACRVSAGAAVLDPAQVRGLTAPLATLLAAADAQMYDGRSRRDSCRPQV